MCDKKKKDFVCQALVSPFSASGSVILALHHIFFPLFKSALCQQKQNVSHYLLSRSCVMNRRLNSGHTLIIHFSLYSNTFVQVSPCKLKAHTSWE